MSVPMHLEFVPAPDIDSQLSARLGQALIREGFEMLSPRAYVRSRASEFRDLVRVLPLKGAAYSTAWGFSLGFVPHLSGDSLRWHRTARAARFDLRYDPIDYLHPDSPEFRTWLISGLYGLGRTEQDIDRVTAKTMKEIGPFFGQVRTCNDLVLSFERQESKRAVRFDFCSYPEHPLAYAFTLASVGRLEEALVQFDRFVKRREPPIAIRPRLEELIRDLATGTSENRA